MVYEFRDFPKLPPSLHRTCIFILLVKLLSPRSSYAIPCATLFFDSKQFTLYLPRFGAYSALDFFFPSILLFPGHKPSPPF